MSTPPPAGPIEAKIEGDVSGQIAIGSYIYQIRDVHGGVINILPPESRPELRPRPRPVRLRPRQFRGLLGREREVGLAQAAVDECAPLEVHGVLGSGRTSLLRHLAYELERAAGEDGIVYLSARGETLDGLLQALTDAFFESGGMPRRLTPTELRHRMTDIRALVLVDDVELDRESLVDLTDGAPGCAFVVTTEERRAWGDFRSLELGGLPGAAAVQLWEREAGPVREPTERQAVEAVCGSVGGLPLRILQAVAAAKEKQEDASAMATRLEAARPSGRPAEPAHEAVGALDVRSRRVLAALITTDSALSISQIALLADLADAEEAGAALDDLLGRRLVVHDGSRFAAAARLPEVAADAEADEERRRAVGLMAAWAAARGDRPAQLQGDVPLLERSLEQALALDAWSHTVSLARSLDGVLSHTGRWDAWHRMLERVAAAAAQQGDDATEAWALHQQGTRAAALGDTAAARAPLTRAFEIRSRLGDVEGAALTRHNIEVAGLPPPAEPTDGSESAGKPEPTAGSGTAGSAGAPAWAVTLGKVAAVGVGVVALGLGAMKVLEAAPTLTPNRLHFGTVTMTDTSSALTVTVTNRGFRSMRVEDVALATQALGFVLGQDRCTGATLRRGGRCEVSLRFTPLTTGDHSGQLTVAYAGGTVDVGLDGIGALAGAGHVVPETDRVDFGAVQVGSTVDRAVTFRNDGDGRVRVAGVEPPAANAFGIDDTSCRDAWLEPGSTCEIVIRFQPGQVGDADALLTLLPDGDEPIRIALRGRGVAVPVGRLAVEPGAADFGTVTAGEVATAALRVWNAGTAPATVGALRLQGSRLFQVRDASACEGATLQPGEECSVRITFSPTAAGDASARLMLAAAAPVEPAIVSLRGRAAERAVGRLAVEPARADFGTVTAGEVATAELHVRNAGTAPATVAGLRLQGSPFFEVHDPSACQGATLRPGEQCRVRITFSPTAAGDASARLTLAAATPVEPAIVSLRGSAAERPLGRLEARPASVRFGQQPIEQRGAPVGVALSNTGNGPIRTGAIAVRGDRSSEFEIVEQDCQHRILQPHSTCRVVVSFVPRGEGSRRAELVVRTEADEGVFQVGLEGIGAAPLLPVLAVEPERLTFRDTPVLKGFLQQLTGALLGGSQKVQLVSRGTAPVRIGRIQVEGDAGDFDVSPRQCQDLGMLAPGQTCEIRVAFRPQAAGPRTARLVIEHGGEDGRSIVALTGTATVTEAPPPQQATPPDLVVRLATRGAVSAARRGAGFLVPIRIQVTNRGGAPAGAFKVAIETANGVVPFDVSNESPIWYAESLGLGAGQSFTRDGVALVRAGEGQTLRLTAFVDSCSGEEFTPAYCKVQESDEDNNRSASVQVQMPIM